MWEHFLFTALLLLLPINTNTNTNIFTNTNTNSKKGETPSVEWEYFLFTSLHLLAINTFTLILEFNFLYHMSKLEVYFVPEKNENYIETDLY